jgi:hypothetical protein
MNTYTIAARNGVTATGAMRGRVAWGARARTDDRLESGHDSVLVHSAVRRRRDLDHALHYLIREEQLQGSGTNAREPCIGSADGEVTPRVESATSLPCEVPTHLHGVLLSFVRHCAPGRVHRHLDIEDVVEPSRAAQVLLTRRAEQGRTGQEARRDTGELRANLP